jgi:hypothetical protein
LKSENQISKKAKSTKIDDPMLYFSQWHFVIEPHHYWTLGLELKTFVVKKVRYQSWAYMTPPDYNFCQGYVFYDRTEPAHFLQVGIEQDLFGIEVFEGHLHAPETTTSGWLTTQSDLATWLQTGVLPVAARGFDLAESKSGLMAWQLVKPSLEQSSAI